MFIFRYSSVVKVIQIDVCPEELHNSVKASVGIQSDLKPAVALLIEALEKKRFKFSSGSDWWKTLNKKCEDNRKNVQVSSNNDEVLFWC